MATGSFTPLRYVQDDMVVNMEERKKKKGSAAPFFPPHPHQPCHPERSEGSRGHTAAVKEPGVFATDAQMGPQITRIFTNGFFPPAPGYLQGMTTVHALNWSKCSNGFFSLAGAQGRSFENHGVIFGVP